MNLLQYVCLGLLLYYSETSNIDTSDMSEADMRKDACMSCIICLKPTQMRSPSFFRALKNCNLQFSSSWKGADNLTWVCCSHIILLTWTVCMSRVFVHVDLWLELTHKVPYILGTTWPFLVQLRQCLKYVVVVISSWRCESRNGTREVGSLFPS